MFSELRKDRRRRIGDRVAADRLTDRDNVAGIGDNFTEIGDDAAGIVDIAANVIKSQIPSWMETGVTLFLEDKFQRETGVTPVPGGQIPDVTLSMYLKKITICFKKCVQTH